VKRVSKSIGNTQALAQEFLNHISPFKKEKNATVVALFGDLGSGKTTFVQQVAKIMNVKDRVTSPTFVVLKIYTVDHSDFDHLIHIDAYRLDGGHELEILGWEQYINNPRNLICIEWPEKVKEVLPQRIHALTFTFIDESTREIEIHYA
jgi:tRNA threonylcarbamoyladenosine biosynthesis protein TsaE